MELPGANPLKELHAQLDKAVRDTYGMPKRGTALPYLLKLNHELAAKEDKGTPIQGPGLPKWVTATTKVASSDCVLEKPI